MIFSLNLLGNNWTYTCHIMQDYSLQEIDKMDGISVTDPFFQQTFSQIRGEKNALWSICQFLVDGRYLV